VSWLTTLERMSLKEQNFQNASMKLTSDLVIVAQNAVEQSFIPECTMLNVGFMFWKCNSREKTGSPAPGVHCSDEKDQVPSDVCVKMEACA
jgi:hypothetical protein